MTWDSYFRSLCDTVALNSKCLSRKIGCVITTKDKTVVSTGYNGPPRKAKHCEDLEIVQQWSKENQGLLECPRRIMGFNSGDGLKYCRAAHAETNAIFAAARDGWALKGCTLYLNTGVPCMECIKAIIQVGIDEVVCTDVGNFYDHISGHLISECGVTVRRFDEQVKE